MTTFHVLTDFSDAAANALHYAVVLARHVGGAIHLWHAQPHPATAEAQVFHAAGPGQMPAHVQCMLQKQVRTIQQALVPCRATLLTEDIIPQLAAQLGTGSGHVLIVGNTNPAKNIRKSERSLALHLVSVLAQPLLVVPITYRAGALPRRIVLDTDRRPVRLPAAAATIPQLLERLTATGQPLTLTGLPGAVDDLLTRVIPAVVGLHVYTTPASPELAEVAIRIQQSGLLTGVAHTVTATRHPSVEEGIRHAATRQQADLLTFVCRQRLYPGPQFRHSVTAGLLAHSRIPVLTIPEC